MPKTMQITIEIATNQPNIVADKHAIKINIANIASMSSMNINITSINNPNSITVFKALYIDFLNF